MEHKIWREVTEFAATIFQGSDYDQTGYARSAVKPSDNEKIYMTVKHDPTLKVRVRDGHISSIVVLNHQSVDIFLIREECIKYMPYAKPDLNQYTSLLEKLKEEKNVKDVDRCIELIQTPSKYQLINAR